MKFESRIVDEWVKLWNVYDLNQVRELFLNDMRVSYFSSEKKGLIKGFEALIKHHADFGFVPGGKKQSNRLWLDDVGIEQFENCVLVTAIWYFQRSGSERFQRGPVTLLYVKVDDDYKIANANFSNYLES